jgi:hypothetical protein
MRGSLTACYSAVSGVGTARRAWGAAADYFQRPLLRHSHSRQQLRHGIDMIDIANGCAKRTKRSDFWCNPCVNHPYFLICTQGKS